MVVFPRAKINLGLSIVEKRSDGFHNIETLFYPFELCDALEFVISPSGKDEFSITGISIDGNPDDNLVLKALAKLRTKYYIPQLKIHLHKAIPSGAGLGGGSSDASCLMKSVTRHFGTGAEKEELKAMASEIGSDCAFFIENSPSFASGRGELLTPAPPLLSGFYLVLLNPGIQVNTAEAYRNCKPAIPRFRISSLGGIEIGEWYKFLRNDFEEFVFSRHPLVGNLKDMLYDSGAIYSSMSGSGSSVFGIFSEKPVLSDKAARFSIWEGLM